MNLYAIIGRLSNGFSRAIRKCEKEYVLSRFKSRGKNVYIGDNCHFITETLSVGDNVHIGRGCCFQSAHGDIKIGNHVMFGPGVHIHGGNHITDVVGVYMDEVKKEVGQDAPVIVDDDVWIGANAMILGGVHIGRGSVIGAASVVTKDVPAYSISVGVPSRVIGMRFDEKTVAKHEKMLRERDKEN